MTAGVNSKQKMKETQRQLKRSIDYPAEVRGRKVDMDFPDPSPILPSCLETKKALTDMEINLIGSPHLKSMSLTALSLKSIYWATVVLAHGCYSDSHMSNNRFRV